MYVGKLDAKSTSHDDNPCVPVEQFQECLGELKQAMQRMNSNEAIDTLSNLSLKQQKEGHCDDCVEVEELNSDINNTSDMDVVSKLPESEEEIPLKPRGSSRSLPRIYYKTTNPSLDEEDGGVWRYVYVQ